MHRPRIRAPARNQHRRPARVPGPGRRRGRQQDVRRQPGRRQGHDRRAFADAHPGEGRTSRRWSVTFLRRNSAPSDEPLQPFTRDHDLQNMNGIPLIDHVQITGPFNATGPGDTPSRRRIFTCRPANASGGAAVRAQDSVEPRAPGLSPAGNGGGSRNSAELLSIGAQQEEFRRGHRERAAADPDQSEIPVPHRDRSGGRGRRARCIRSAIWNWPRACRSSCGAASPTTS